MKKLICITALLITFSTTVFSQFQGWNNVTGRSRFRDSMANDKLRNNALGDSVLSTDINGKFKNVLKGNSAPVTYYGVDSVKYDTATSTMCVWSFGIANCFVITTDAATITTGVDSVVVTGTQLCTWTGGVSACYTISSTINNNNYIDTVINNFITQNNYNYFGNCTNRVISGSATIDSLFAGRTTVITFQLASCSTYTVPAATFNITPSTNADRYSLVYVDTSGNVGTIDGTSNPASIPNIVDDLSQIAVVTYLIPAFSTTPIAVTSDWVYRERDDDFLNLRGTVTTGFDSAYTVNPFAGLYSLRIPTQVSGEHFDWLGGTKTAIDYSFLTWQFRLSDTAGADTKLAISFYNDSSLAASNSVIVSSGSFGYDRTVSGAYQDIAIPFASWNWVSPFFNKIRVTFLGNSSVSQQWDEVKLQTGGVNTNQGTFVQSVNNDFGPHVNLAITDSGAVSTDTSTYDYYDKRTQVKLFSLPTFVKYVYYDSCFVVDTVGRNVYVAFNQNCGGSGGTGVSGIVELGVSATLDKANDSTYELKTVNSNVGSFTNANVTVDAKGRVIAASNGTNGNDSAYVRIRGAADSSYAVLDHTYASGLPPDTLRMYGSASSAGGTDGNTVLNGSGVPSGGIGVDGDFYINTTANTIYGPKTSGAWGSPTSLVGPTGATGATGPTGPAGGGGGSSLYASTGLSKLADSTSLIANLVPVNKVNFLYGSTYNAEGNSITALSSPYPTIIAPILGVTLNNTAVSSSSIRDDIFRRFTNAETVNTSQPLSIMEGINDLSTSFLSPQKISNGLNVILANQFLETFWPIDTTAITYTGTWSTLTSGSNLSSKSVIKSRGVPKKSSTAGDKFSFTHNGKDLVIGTYGLDTSSTYGSFKITSDGVVVKTFDVKNRSNSSTGVTAFDTRMPIAVVVTGLRPGNHLIEVELLENKEVDFDYIGRLKEPSNSQPVLMFHVGYVKSNIYSGGSKNRIDSTNLKIDSIARFWTDLGYPVAVARTNNYFDTTNTSDGLHPNSTGQQQLANAAFSVLDTIGLAPVNSINWMKGGNPITTFAVNTIGTTTNRGMNFITNGISGGILDSSQNWRLGTGAVSTNKLMVYGAVGANGDANSVNYYLGANGIIQGNGNVYIRGNSSSTGTVNIQATTATTSGALTSNGIITANGGVVAPGYLSNPINIISGVNGYQYHSVKILHSPADTFVLAINENSLIKRVGVRATSFQIRNDATALGTAVYNPSALLELNSTTSGFVLPRLTTSQRNAVSVTGVSTGTIVGGGSYPGATYYNVPLTGGSGTGAQAKIGASGSVLSVVLTTPGSGYAIGDVLSATLPSGSGFTYTLTALTGTPGLTVFDTDLNRSVTYDGTSWKVPEYTTTGTAAPATTPAAIGDKFVDTTNKKIYFATGTSSSADWTIMN